MPQLASCTCIAEMLACAKPDECNHTLRYCVRSYLSVACNHHIAPVQGNTEGNVPKSLVQEHLKMLLVYVSQSTSSHSMRPAHVVQKFNESGNMMRATARTFITGGLGHSILLAKCCTELVSAPNHTENACGKEYMCALLVSTILFLFDEARQTSRHSMKPTDMVQK